MNIVELRQMMVAFKGSIWWYYKGVEFIVSYDKSDLHGIPYLLINGKVIAGGQGVIGSRRFLMLNYIFSETEVKQIRYLLHPVSIFEPHIEEEIRFLKQELTGKAKFILSRTSLTLKEDE